MKVVTFARFVARGIALCWGAGKVLFLGSMLSSVVAALVVPLQILLLATTVDLVSDVVGSGSAVEGLEALAFPVAAMAVLWLLGGVMGPVGDSLGRLFMLKLERHVQGQLLRKASALDLALFDDQRFYDKLSIAKRDCRHVGDLPIALVFSVRSWITLVSVLGLLATFTPWAVLILSATVIPELLFRSRVNSRLYRMWNDQAPIRRLCSYFESLLADREPAKETRLFGLGASLLKRFGRAQVDLYRQERRILGVEIRGLGLLGLLSVAGTVAIWTWAAADAVRGALALGTLVMVFQSAERARAQLQDSARGAGMVIESRLYAQSYFDFIDLDPGDYAGSLRPAERQVAVPTSVTDGIDLTGVSFEYPGTERPVLRNLDLRLRAGERVAIVGENGAGKTTLVKLLTRLYDPTGGSIEIDGVDYRDYDVSGLRKLFGVAFQDHVEFHLTARENVGFGDIERLDDTEAIMDAIRGAAAQEMVEQLPSGLDTMLGRTLGEGTDLSGGQWQKLALARAFFRDGAVLILDEPTAALDARAEHELFDHILAESRGRTTIIISHRFSTVRSADRILVLHEGEIVEDGDHASLMEHNGRYAEMFRLQASRYTDPPAEQDEEPEQE
ncbi:MAG: ABC transporter ATP-binding protein [Spirochaetaceae bacterium]|nr:ABC transporter ATP-binding protein [Spirochaetaceae bacterium]